MIKVLRRTDTQALSKDLSTGRPFSRTIWVKEKNPKVIQILDQRYLPHRVVIEDLSTLEEVVRAIKEMHVRGAPLIGVTAAFGLYLALLEGNSSLQVASEKLLAARPTAVNLKCAVERVLKALKTVSSSEDQIRVAFETASQIADEDIEMCRRIGEHASKLIEELGKKKRGEPVNILTHCNAGWLACVEWGTATSGIYQAFEKKIKLHVWVDETRPRNQGASLTAWELGERKIPHTLITDSSAGHMMQKGKVDIIFVGTDRATRSGDVANKIGTYLVALAAKENKVPFYAAVPSTSIDWTIDDGLKQIPIEERASEEVTHVRGLSDGEIKKVRVAPEGTQALNYAFDVTPRHLITGLITERGITRANRANLAQLFPEKQ